MKFIGEKMIKKFKRNSKNFLKAKKVEIVRMMVLLQKAKLIFRIVLNYLAKLKLYQSKMLGIAQSALILYWPKNKCKFTKLLRYWSFAWRDLEAKDTINKSLICKLKNYFSLVDFPVENFDISKFVISKNLPTHDIT